MTETNSSDFLPIAQAVRRIGTDKNPVSTTAVLRAARRLNLAYADAADRTMLAASDVAAMADNYGRLGYLHARGAVDHELLPCARRAAGER